MNDRTCHQLTNEALDLCLTGAVEPYGEVEQPEIKKNFQPKTSNFKMKKGYEALLEIHRDFGPFQSEAALDVWRSWFLSDIEGELKKLLEACMFAHSVIASASGVWFDDTDYDEEEFDLKTELFSKYGKEKIKCVKQRKYRALLKQSGSLVTNCLMDLISDKFQSIYLGKRQESGENWIRVGGFVFVRTRLGTIKATKMYMADLSSFILGDDKKKREIINKYYFGHLDSFYMVGSTLGESLRSMSKYTINDALRDFIGSVLMRQREKNLAGNLKSGNPLFKERPKLHFTAYKRGVGLSRQALGFDYLSGAGSAFVKQFFDKKTLSETAKVYGVRAKLEDYNRIALTPQIDCLLKEFNNELPVLARLLKVMTKRDWASKFETFNKVRALYVEAGLTPAGWRLLKRISPIDVHKLIPDSLAFRICRTSKAKKAEGQISATEFQFLSETGNFCHTKPRARLLPALHDLYRGGNYGNADVRLGIAQRKDPYKHFFRAIAQHVLASDDTVQNLRNLCSDATDAFLYNEVEWINNLIGNKKITPARALRIIQLAHDEMHRRPAHLGKASFYSWKPALEEFCSGKYVFRELSDTTAAYREGDEMHHCIGNYSKGCASGGLRLFSGRVVGSEKRGDRISIALRKDKEDQWVIQQVRGFANRSVTKQESKAAKALCRAVQQATKDQG